MVSKSRLINIVNPYDDEVHQIHEDVLKIISKRYSKKTITEDVVLDFPGNEIALFLEDIDVYLSQNGMKPYIRFTTLLIMDYLGVRDEIMEEYCKRIPELVIGKGANYEISISRYDIFLQLLQYGDVRLANMLDINYNILFDALNYQTNIGEPEEIYQYHLYDQVDGHTVMIPANRRELVELIGSLVDNESIIELFKSKKAENKSMFESFKPKEVKYESYPVLINLILKLAKSNPSLLNQIKSELKSKSNYNFNSNVNDPIYKIYHSTQDMTQTVTCMYTSNHKLELTFVGVQNKKTIIQPYLIDSDLDDYFVFSFEGEMKGLDRKYLNDQPIFKTFEHERETLYKIKYRELISLSKLNKGLTIKGIMIVYNISIDE